MAVSVEALTQQAESIHSRYRKSFVGRSRATRDLDALDGIIADMRRIKEQLPANAGALAGTVDDWSRLYSEERERIATLKAAGQPAIDAARLSEWNEVTNHRYMQQFAGQDRRTRDLALLQEMLADTNKWIAKAEALPPLPADAKDGPLAVMRQNAALYAGEVTQIAASRSLLSANEHARILATAANRQFGLYRAHFQDKPRFSRRPALLRRIISGLEDIRRAMEALRDVGLNSPTHEANAGKVRERIAFYRGELAQIEAARSSANLLTIVGNLGDEANKEFGAYRAEFAGQRRETRDLARLTDICDNLHEIARNMADLEAERPEGTNRKNLSVVLENLKSYGREWAAIKESREKRTN